MLSERDILMLLVLSRLFDKRRGGYAKSVKRMVIWLLVLTIGVLILSCLYIPRAKNYTALWNMVSNIDQRVLRLERNQ